MNKVIIQVESDAIAAHPKVVGEKISHAIAYINTTPNAAGRVALTPTRVRARRIANFVKLAYTHANTRLRIICNA